MAMIHPDDRDFALKTTFSDEAIAAAVRRQTGLESASIRSPSGSQGQYNKIFFVTLGPGSSSWAGKDVVLRLARPAFPRIKILNEAAFLRLARGAGVPVPEVLAWEVDEVGGGGGAHCSLGYEFIIMERIPFPSLLDTYTALTAAQLDLVLDQLVDIFVKLYEVDLDAKVLGGRRIGGLTIAEGATHVEQVACGMVLEETGWGLSDIKRYFHDAPYGLVEESLWTLNPSSSNGYPHWVAYVSAFLKTYIHVIEVHPNVAWLVDLLPSLRSLVSMLDAENDDGTLAWVKELKTMELLKGRVWHRDLHFGNFLIDEHGTVQALIDWEFSGIGPSFHSTSDPLSNAIYAIEVSEQASHSNSKAIVSQWPDLFLSKLERRSPPVHESWLKARQKEAVLGVKGVALANVREYLRSCLEVGVRGAGRVEIAKTSWKGTVAAGLKEIGV